MKKKLDDHGIYEFVGEDLPKNYEDHSSFRFRRTTSLKRAWDRIGLPEFPIEVCISADVDDLFDRTVEPSKAKIREWQIGLQKMLDFYYLSWEIILRTRNGQLFICLVDATLNEHGFITEKALFRRVGHGKKIRDVMLEFERMGVAEKFWHANRCHWNVSTVGLAWWRQITGI